MNEQQPEALRLADRIDLEDYYEFDASLHCQKAAAELRRLHQVELALKEWISKTEWVQESSEAEDLGRHRADVMKQRIDRLHDENEALRAALEQHSSLTCKQDLQVPSGFVLLQTREGKPVYAACLDGGRFNGWLMWKHPDGQWISKRKLENWEIMQAEDQRDSGIVQGIDND